MLTGTANFRNLSYHSPNDTYETIDFAFMTKVVQAVVATLAEEAALQNSSFAEEAVEISIIKSTAEILRSFNLIITLAKVFLCVRIIRRGSTFTLWMNIDPQIASF